MGRENALVAELRDAHFPATGKAFNVPNSSGDAWLIGWGPTVPSDTATNWAIGAIFVHTDGGDDTALYVNEGTAGSADFNAIAGA